MPPEERLSICLCILTAWYRLHFIKLYFSICWARISPEITQDDANLIWEHLMHELERRESGYEFTVNPCPFYYLTEGAHQGYAHFRHHEIILQSISSRKKLKLPGFQEINSNFSVITFRSSLARCQKARSNAESRSFLGFWVVIIIYHLNRPRKLSVIY